MPIEHSVWVIPTAAMLLKNQDEIVSLWQKVTHAVNTRQSKIIVTGNSGVGKTVLLDCMNGNAFKQGYRPPAASRAVEVGKIIKPAEKQRVNIVNIPGQGSAPRTEALRSALLSGEPIDGVIHVVSAGYRTVRADNIQKIIEEQGAHTLALYREKQFEAELTDLLEICELIRTSIRNYGQPRWLIIAVNKADLFIDELQAVSEYYSPNGESRFVNTLQTLQHQVGSDNLFWDALPVCGWLEDFAWNMDVVRTKLTPQYRDYYIAELTNTILGLCRPAQ